MFICHWWNHWILVHPLDATQTIFFSTISVIIANAIRVSNSIINDMSNRRSTLTHSYIDTNITLYPYWKAGSRDQLVVDTQSTYCQFCNASYRPFPNTKSWWSMFWLICLFVPLFFTPSIIVWETNDIAQPHLNLNEYSSYPALDSWTVGLTYNTSYLILMNLSLTTVGLPFNTHNE